MRLPFSLALTLAWMGLCCSSELIPFNNANLSYFGRWTITPEGIQSGWPGAYLKTTVSSTSVQLRLARPGRVIVRFDNEPARIVDAPFQGTLPIQVDLTPKGLSAGQHTLMLMADNNTTVALEGLLLSSGGHVTLQTNISSHLIEFVGHGLILGQRSSRQFLTGFPWLVADRLGVERALVAYDEASLMSHADVPGMETRYFWASNARDDLWDFSVQPSVVVILLGRYDDDMNAFGHHFSQFLRRVRERLPSASILVLSEPLGHKIRSTQAAVSQRNDEEADQDVHYVDTTGWVRIGSDTFIDGDHLSDAGHQAFASKLLPLLEAALARQPLPGPLPNPSLPSSWQTMDVGDQQSVGLHGSVSFDAGSTFTLWGSGADIARGRDAFRFVYQPISDQGAIEATIQSHSTFAPCAKAGIMFREHLGPGAAHLLFGISPADGLFLQTRQFNLNTTTVLKKTRASPPARLRLVRKPDAFVAQIIQSPSPDAPWETFATVTTTVLAQDIYVGLAVTSCDTSVVSVAKFVDVTLEGGVGSGGYVSSMPPRLVLQGASA